MSHQPPDDSAPSSPSTDLLTAAPAAPAAPEPAPVPPATPSAPAPAPVEVVPASTPASAISAPTPLSAAARIRRLLPGLAFVLGLGIIAGGLRILRGGQPVASLPPAVRDVLLDY